MGAEKELTIEFNYSTSKIIKPGCFPEGYSCCYKSELFGLEAWVITFAMYLIRRVLSYHFPPKLEYLSGVLSLKVKFCDEVRPDN